MKNLPRYVISLLACMTFTTVTACDNKTEEDSQISVISDVTTTGEAVPESTTVPEEVPTEDTTEETTEDSADGSTENASEETTENSEENSVDYMSILTAYHQAYIDGNADAVYALFNPDEITAFDTHMKEYLKNEGESEDIIENMMSKENIMSAIKGSIDNINDIMDNYNQSANDSWSIIMNDNTVEHYKTEELAQINADLGLNITDGYICEIPFYRNDANQETFVAEPASVFQIDGNWYVSYSLACDRLIEFMDIDF